MLSNRENYCELVWNLDDLWTHWMKDRRLLIFQVTRVAANALWQFHAERAGDKPYHLCKRHERLGFGENFYNILKLEADSGASQNVEWALHLHKCQCPTTNTPSTIRKREVQYPEGNNKCIDKINKHQQLSKITGHKKCTAYEFQLKSRSNPTSEVVDNE